MAVALAAGIATAGGAAPALPPALVQLGPVDGRVLRVTVTPEGGAGGWSEAVAPSSGHCRRELPGSVTIAGRRTWALTDEHGTTVRTGSRAFLGRLLDVCYSLAPIGRAIAAGRPVSAGSEVSLSRAGVRGTAQVEEELSGDAARALFAVPLDVVESWAVERRLGTRPWQRIRAYWLGRGFGRWKAETSVEAFYAEQQVTLHDVYYRAGRRELEVISRPRAQAAGTIADLRSLGRLHRWPRYVVQLASRERATVYADLSQGRSPVASFTVVTARTAVTVSGGVVLREVPKLARILRRIGTNPQLLRRRGSGDGR